MYLKWIGAIMNSFNITLFVVAYVVGFAVSIAIFYKLNSICDEDIPEDKNMDLSTAIFLSLFSWLSVLLVLLVTLIVGITHIFEKSKFNEKYKALNERFMHKKRDKKDG